jgi:hypothetical protein
MKEETKRRAEAYEQNKVKRALRISKRDMRKMESDARIDSVSRKLAVTIIELAPTCETFEMAQAIPKAIMTALTLCDITDNQRKFLQSLVLQLNYHVRKDKEREK